MEIVLYLEWNSGELFLLEGDSIRLRESLK
jgi:hypothetical protein